VALAGLTVGMTHRLEGGETALEMWGRAHDADLVLWGHTHTHRVVDAGGVVLLNPGSHHDPRGGPATHVELRRVEDGVTGAVRTRDGDRLARITVPSQSEGQERGR
jgi:putative phosphoesterase